MPLWTIQDASMGWLIYQGKITVGKDGEKRDERQFLSSRDPTPDNKEVLVLSKELTRRSYWEYDDVKLGQVGPKRGFLRQYNAKGEEVVIGFRTEREEVDLGGENGKRFVRIPFLTTDVKPEFELINETEGQ